MGQGTMVFCSILCAIGVPVNQLVVVQLTGTPFMKGKFFS